MKHWNTHALAQLTLDDKALGRLDILKIDPTKGWLKARNNFDKFVWVLFVDLNIEYINASEFLEQYRFTFHHRL